MATAIPNTRSSQNPREVKPDDFPAAASTEDQLKFLVNYAVLAPSVHNTQPWLYRVLDRTVEVYADRSRALPVTDPEDRLLIISCGSTVQLFLDVLRAFGFDTSCSIFPDLRDPDLLARITASPRPVDAPVDGDVIRAIKSRNTIRRGFLNLPLPGPFLERFAPDSEQLPASVCVISDAEAESLILAQLLQTERSYRDDIHYRRESESWMHPMRARSRDGVPMPPEESDPIASCWSTSDLSGDATQLAVLTEKQDTPRAWLQTGQELMEVLLAASELGVNAAIMNLAPSSELVNALIRPIAGCEGDPILLLRFGRPRRKLITPRRSPVDVMLHPGFRH